MVPPLLDAPHDETEFDLDVRLQAVARRGSIDRAERPQTVSCGHECEEGSNSPACCTIGAGRAAN
jgi:hypothetical protein